MPSEDGVGRDDGADFRQGFATDGLAKDGESSPLIIGDWESLVAELLSEDLVFSLEVLDHSLLVLIKHAGKEYAQKLPG